LRTAINLYPLPSYVSPIKPGLPIRVIQQLHRVRHIDGKPRGPESGADLHQTTGISRHHEVRPRCRGAQAGDLLVEHSARHPGTKHGIDPGAATAAVGSRQQSKAKAGHGAEQGERRFVHLLGMLQVAGGIVGDIQLQRRADARTALRQQLGDVADLRPESSGTLGTQQVPVVLEQRAAARAVHDDEVGSFREGLDVGLREPGGAAAVAGVLV
jgi:hypothetical protein